MTKKEQRRHNNTYPKVTVQRLNQALYLADSDIVTYTKPEE